jgi:hypothetical protein
MKTLLNGSVTLNVSSTLSEMSSTDVKIKLHPDVLVGGSLVLRMPNGEEIIFEINDFENVQLDTLCPESGLPILSDDIDYTV